MSTTTTPTATTSITAPTTLLTLPTIIRPIIRPIFSPHVVKHAAQHPMKTKTFPWKLHEMLELAEQEGYEKIVSWLPDGRSFKVYTPNEFVQKIMPNFFLQSKYKSFQRQCKCCVVCRNRILSTLRYVSYE